MNDTLRIVNNFSLDEWRLWLESGHDIPPGLSREARRLLHEAKGVNAATATVESGADLPMPDAAPLSLPSPINREFSARVA